MSFTQNSRKCKVIYSVRDHVSCLGTWGTGRWGKECYVETFRDKQYSIILTVGLVSWVRT